MGVKSGLFSPRPVSGPAKFHLAERKYLIYFFYPIVTVTVPDDWAISFLSIYDTFIRKVDKIVNICIKGNQLLGAENIFLYSFL